MSRKPFDVHDHGLWDEVTRTIKPLSRRKSKPAAAKAHATGESATAGIHSKPLDHQVRPRMRHDGPPPPLASFDRRTAQKLSRGQMEPDARIDLHGEGVEMARVKLLHFITSQRHQGARLVLVITGKGASPFGRHTLHGTTHFHAPEREGRLRREVPHWLHEEAFRLHAVGFQPAHPRHGGGGAFYVRLRRSGPGGGE